MAHRFIRWPELHKKVGKSRAQTWRDERADLFPKRRRLGKNSIGWLESEVDAWIDERSPVVSKQRKDGSNG